MTLMKRYLIERDIPGVGGICWPSYSPLLRNYEVASACGSTVTTILRKSFRWQSGNVLVSQVGQAVHFARPQPMLEDLNNRPKQPDAAFPNLISSV